MANERTATNVDSYVGQRIKAAREGLGLSQEKLAFDLGISFQQVQKYERGFNRVGASRLYQISQALNKPVAHFFEGLGDSVSIGTTENEVAGLLAVPLALPLLRAHKAASKPVQTKIFELVQLLSDHTK